MTRNGLVNWGMGAFADLHSSGVRVRNSVLKMSHYTDVIDSWVFQSEKKPTDGASFFIFMFTQEYVT